MHARLWNGVQADAIAGHLVPRTPLAGDPRFADYGNRIWDKSRVRLGRWLSWSIVAPFGRQLRGRAPPPKSSSRFYPVGRASDFNYCLEALRLRLASAADGEPRRARPRAPRTARRGSGCDVPHGPVYTRQPRSAERFETALPETMRHHARFMARTNEAPGWTPQFRELVPDVDARLRDLRDNA